MTTWFLIFFALVDMRKIKIYNFVSIINIFFIFLLLLIYVKNIEVKKVYLYSDATQYKNVIDEFISKKKFMFSVNATDLLGQFEDQSKIRTIDIKKKLPFSLHIDLKNHIPTFLWNNMKVLNEHGEPIKYNTNNSNLIILEGPENLFVEVLDSYKLLNNLLKKKELNISKLSLSNYGNWQLIVENFTEINLGKKIDFIKINQVFLFFLDKGYDLSKIKRIDIRYPDGFSYAEGFR